MTPAHLMLAIVVVVVVGAFLIVAISKRWFR
jgi:hypothetical protein